MNGYLYALAIRVLIVLVAVTWLVLLLRADKNPLLKNFTILGYITTKDGYPDRPATMEIGTWIALTFTLVVLVMNDRLTEWFVLIYGGLPAIRAGQASWQRANAAANPVPSSMTETLTTKKETTVP